MSATDLESQTRYDPAEVEAVLHERARLALLAEADVLVPVELERGGQVVDLGQAHVLRPDAGLLVRRVRDRLLERPLGLHPAVGVGREVGHVQDRVGEGRRHRRDGVDPHCAAETVPLGVLGAGDDHCRRAVGGRSTRTRASVDSTANGPENVCDPEPLAEKIA